MIRPIIFQTDMVKAIYADIKGQTRRTRGLKEINRNPDDWKIFKKQIISDEFIVEFQMINTPWFHSVTCPYGIPGDQLYVKETFKMFDDGDCYFKADFTKDGKTYIPVHADDDPDEWRWTPSIFMKKEYARLHLTLTDIGIMRVKDISVEDIEAEGYWYYRIPEEHEKLPDKWWREVWDSINAKKGLGMDVNPWVWKLKFERVR